MSRVLRPLKMTFKMTVVCPIMQVMERDDQRCVCQECWLKLRPDMPYPQMDVSLILPPLLLLQQHTILYWLQCMFAKACCLCHANTYITRKHCTSTSLPLQTYQTSTIKGMKPVVNTQQTRMQPAPMAACWQLDDMPGSGHVTWEWYKICAKLLCAV